MPGFERQRRALQEVVHRHEPVLEEVDQRRLLRHLWQARIGAHQEILARITRPELGAADVIKVAVRHVEQRRFGGDLVVELVHHFFFELVRLLRQRQRPRRGVRSHTIAPDNSGGLAANCPTWSASAPVYTQFDSSETLLCRIGRKAVSGHGPDRGVVFQDFAQLFPWRTALGNVSFGLEMKGIGKTERERIALEHLKLVKLEKFVQSYPHHLSGGMQQRVAIARALAYNPSVLLMDEPFAALDALTRDDMQRLLAEVWRETRKTVVYVTHNVAEAVYLADRVVVMTPHPGMVKTQLPVHLPRPRDPLSVEFLDYQKSVLRHLGEDAAAASK